MVNSATIPHSKLHKRHNALSFHCVHEAITAKYISMYHLSGEFNPVDILTKPSVNINASYTEALLCKKLIRSKIYFLCNFS
jgi:hypothetical protein